MINTDFRIHTLSNGIRLIHQPAVSPVGHLGVIVNAGSRDEEEQEHGIAHFIEHSIFKGTKKRRAFHVLSRIEDVGGEMNAYTTKEETALFATFLTGYLERSAELLSDILFNSMFPEKELSREKEVVVEEINSFKDTPSDLIFDDFEELVFDGHPIARNILGTPEMLKEFNRNSILKFMERTYTTDQIVVSSVGNFHLGKLKNLIEKYFGHVPSSTRKFSREKFDHYIPESKIETKDTFQSHCIVGNIAYDSAHPNRIPMVLVNNLLGGQALNSRLTLALRERMGLAYNIESNYTSYSDTGLFLVYFGTDKGNIEKATELVYREFKKLQENRLGILQLSKAKKQLIGQLAVSTENREDMMLAIGKSLLLYDKVDPLEKVVEKIESIDALQVMEVANQILDRDRMCRLVYR